MTEDRARFSTVAAPADEAQTTLYFGDDIFKPLDLVLNVRTSEILLLQDVSGGKVEVRRAIGEKAEAMAEGDELLIIGHAELAE